MHEISFNFPTDFLVVIPRTSALKCWVRDGEGEREKENEKKGR
jgi:hypothetical protein